MTDSLLRNSRAEKTFHARTTTINYWRSFTALIGIHEVIPSSSNLRSHRLVILQIFKTFFSHLALTLPNDKRVVGMAKPSTISDHVTKVLYLHTLIDYQLDSTGLVAHTIEQMTQGREQHFRDMDAPLHNPTRHASNQDIMRLTFQLPWDDREIITKNAFCAGLSLLSIGMMRPHCLFQTRNQTFRISQDLPMKHVKWFHVRSYTEIKPTPTSIRQILRERNVFVAIKRPFTKNSRHVKNVTDIIARIEKRSANWTPVAHIAMLVLEILVSTNLSFENLSNDPLFTLKNSRKWLPYHAIHRIYKARTRSALTARDNKSPSTSEMLRWTLYSQKIFYKAALDAKEVPPEITRQLGAWAPVAGDTPYSRMNEAQINNARKRLVNSNEKFLEITW